MSQQVIEINCPGCGARVQVGQAECEWCHQPVVISTFNSVYSMQPDGVSKYAGIYKEALLKNPDSAELNNAIAMCYLKLRLYEKALISFEKAIEENFDNSETYFYAGVCLLKGKKAFFSVRPVIDKIERYLRAAIMIEPKGIYYYFLAYLRYDYFYRKAFKVSPNYKEVLAMAKMVGYSRLDEGQFFEILGVEKPPVF